MRWQKKLDWSADCKGSGVTTRQKLEVLLLACGVAVSRFVFRSHDLYDLDSVNFALGMARFDPRVHQPHPPGYFLYVCLGRVLNFFVHDANLALVTLSILASIACVALVYRLALEWFGARAAMFAGLLFLFSPLAWFHGTVALTYAVEAAASALMGLLCWQIERGKTALIVPAAIAMGITAGIRPSSIVFLTPLFLWSLRRASWKRILLGVTALAATVSAWFFAMLAACGGWDAYFGALRSLWLMVPSKTAVWNSSPMTSVARAMTILFIYFLCFGGAVFAPVWALFTTAKTERSKKLFTAVWVTPALCFFTLVFLKMVNSGYLLLVAAPACIWLGHWAAEWYELGSWPRILKQLTIAACAVANVYLFLALPVYSSYRSVRQFEGELAQVQEAMPTVGSPDKLLVVSFDNHFLGYRHAGYYLPDYMEIEYPEANLLEGKRIFAMHQRNSFLLSSLPSGGYSRFVLCPLPNGDAGYVEYVAKVKALLPAKDLKTEQLGGHEFVTAPIADLPLLFPDAAPAVGRQASGNVYTLRSTGQSKP